MDNEIIHNYEGYIWYSNKNKPEIIENKNNIDEFFKSEQNNPFIIEGQIYDSENKKSYSLKHVNGVLLKGKEYDINEIQNDTSICKRERKFTSHRMENKTLHFIEVWRKEVDVLCENMNVYKPHELIFTGFNKVEP